MVPAYMNGWASEKRECRKEKSVLVKLKGGGHRVPPAGLPIEHVLGEYSLSFPS